MIDQAVRVKNPTGMPGFTDGKIDSKNADGTYDVLYNNGKIEQRVLSTRIALPAAADDSVEGRPTASSTMAEIGRAHV